MSSPAGWHPDPYGRSELRYWDGSTWTAHVSNGGVQSTDVPEVAPPSAVLGGADPGKIQKQVQKGTGGTEPVVGGGGTLFTEPVLVVNQKAKLIELTNQYAVYDQNGSQVGAVHEVGQSAAKKVLRLVSNVDQFLTHSYQVTDMQNRVVLEVTRPRKILKSTVVVSRPGGGEIGHIRQENMIGKIRFGFDVGGRRVGGINAENWRAWNFSIQDEGGTEVARITKTWEGLAKAMFTSADNYVLQMHRPLEDPLLSLVVASALTVDTALKQDNG